MKRTLLALALLLPLLAARDASAQVSIWLQRGVSGYGGALTLGTNDSATSFGATGGYSYQGFLDFDLNLNYISYKTAPGAFGVSAFSVEPVVQYHPLKQSAEMPVSLGVLAGVTKYFYQSDAFTNGAGLDETDLTVGVAVYRFFKITSNIGVIPAAGFSYTHGWITITNTSGQSASGDGNGEALSFGGYFAYIDDAGRIFGLVPSITVGLGDNSTTTFGIEFGIILSQQ